MQETPVQFLHREDSPGEGIGYPLQYSWASIVAQLLKNPPAMRETWVRSLGWEDPLEKGKATHSSILAWRIPWTVWGCKRVGHDEQLSLNLQSVLYKREFQVSPKPHCWVSIINSCLHPEGAPRDSTTLYKSTVFKENERVHMGIISSLSFPPVNSSKAPTMCLL